MKCAKFWVFKALIENQIGKKIKLWSTKDRREYTSKDFDAFCKEISINKEQTVPYNLKHNGVIEEELIHHRTVVNNKQ